jgi:hypothetical protein
MTLFTKTPVKYSPSPALGCILAGALILAFPWGAKNSEASAILLALTLLCILFYIRQSFNAIVGWLISLVVVVNGTAFFLDSDYSSWQFMRSGIPFLSAIVAILAGIQIGRASQNKQLGFVFKSLAVAASLNIVGYFVGAFLPNALITVEGRIFSAPCLAFLPILYYFMLRHQWPIALVCFCILAATGSKAILLSSAIVLVLGWRHAYRLSFLSIAVFMLIIGVIFLAFGIYDDRFQELLASGDIGRVRQIEEAWRSITNGTFGTLFGHSFGSATLMGYSEFGEAGEENERLFENYRYDLDNGFLLVLLKLGFVGTALLAWLYWRLPLERDGRNLVLVVVLTNLLSSGSIIMSADGAFCHLVLGIVAAKFGGTGISRRVTLPAASLNIGRLDTDIDKRLTGRPT